MRQVSFDEIVWGGYQYGAEVTDSPIDDIERLMDDYDAIKDPKSWVTVVLMVLMFSALGLGIWFLYLAFFGDTPEGLSDFLKTVSGGIGPKTPTTAD